MSSVSNDYLRDAKVGSDDAMIHVAAFSHASGLMSLPFLSRGAAQVLEAAAELNRQAAALSRDAIDFTSRVRAA